MANYLFRRDARYYARLRIPGPLQAAYGKPDLRALLETTDYGQARLRVLEVVLSWKRDFVRLQTMLDARQVVTGSALLIGDGLIPLESAARECGLRIEDMLREAINRAVELRLEATGWQGADLAANALVTDYDGLLLPVDSVLGHDVGTVTGTLFLRLASLPLVASGRFEDYLFFRDISRLQAVVAHHPGVSVAVGCLLIEKADAEAIRVALAGNVTPAMVQAAAEAAARPTLAVPGHKYGAMHASELLDQFFKAKAPDWSEATKIQTPPMCSVFVELMNDPVLADIDGRMMLAYRERLMTLPDNLAQARRRFKVTALADLIKASEGLPTMLGPRADDYLAKISEAFNWCAIRGFMPANPAAGVVGRRKKTRRQQDDREEISPENLSLIFSAPWFVAGMGTRTSIGTYREFRPSYFWLPLLALFSGGRLNELAQLHLKDITQTAAGVWFLDFNLVGSGKIDEPDKSLKTVNSVRRVPLHPELLRLGLVEYVQALALAKHDRLFPELTFNRIKGYGKAAGQWFNERFLGTQLKIKRDGRQTFHSLRHNFINALTQLTPPIGEFTINQLSGHERGETMSGNRYAKDASPDILRVHIDRLTFVIPKITPFNVAEGLVALNYALDQKKQV